jgi:isoquinoline 1-oxidoreductase alpha subunit
MISLTVNGELIRIDAPDDSPLLRVLRDMLNLTGTKFGFGIAQCGSCTVHVNGRSRRSFGLCRGITRREWVYRNE